MSELINNSSLRKETLKHLITELHKGVAPAEVKKRLVSLMQQIPYGEIVEVEQELISEGLPVEEVFKLCDIHALVLDGSIDTSGFKMTPMGHPVDTFLKENIQLVKTIEQLDKVKKEIDFYNSSEIVNDIFFKYRGLFNNLMDIEKHYQRKENLLFPFLEKYGITGPPKVMWGKHDESRKLLKSGFNSLSSNDIIGKEEFQILFEHILKPAIQSIVDMIYKEEHILLPMLLDKLSDIEWYEIQQQSDDIGYCLYDPIIKWKPKDIDLASSTSTENNSINLPSGSFTTNELLAILNTLPVDMTFVDKNDKVKYFSQGSHRIFNRNRAILKRDVRMCHPPSSVNVVENILSDFKSGKETKAPFWIEMQGKFILIEYFALKDENGDYLGTLEVSQDLTEARNLKGEQRLLSYLKEKNSNIGEQIHE